MMKICLTWMMVLVVMLAACNLSIEAKPPKITQTPVPTALEATLVSPAFPTLEPFTGPYGDATPVVSGVCFEYLSTLDGTIWAWTSSSDLDSFYNQVDAEDLCAKPVARWPFDFSDQVLAGAVNTATGCDAAHRFLDLLQDDAAKTVTLRLRFEVLPGCDYELAQPFLIVLPRPPDGYTLSVQVE